MKIADVVCTFCGVLCDDLEITVEEGEIREVARGCRIAREKFLNHDRNLARPRIWDRETTIEEAIAEACRILCKSDHPLVYGLSSTSAEAQRLAIEVAEMLGASIDSTVSVCHGPGTQARQMIGMVTCTLGEVKNRADLIVFWGCNPAEAHLRHLAKHSAMPRGMFIPGGRKDRTLVVVDVRRTATARAADQFIQVEPGKDYEALSALRALVKGEDLGVAEVGGVKTDCLQRLAERMKSARYGVVFVGMGLTMSRGKYMNVAAALSLARDLNQFARFSVIPMRGHGNVAGSENTLGWQTGFPFSVDFSRGYPRYNPGEFSAVDLLARGDVDAALILASDPAATFPVRAASRLAEIPTIVIDPHENETTRIAKVVIPSAISGISAGGTAYRMDNVPLQLKKVVDSSSPSDCEILEMLKEGVRRCSG